MDFGFNQEQELLRATARKFLESECTSEFVRTRMAEPAGVTDAFWAKLAEQGWLGLIYPEAFGGAGLGFVDLTVLMEEMGRAVMPGPFFSTVLLGGLTILEAGSDAQKKEWLGKIGDGQAKVDAGLHRAQRALGRRGRDGDGARERRQVHAERDEALRAGRAPRRRARGRGPHARGQAARGRAEPVPRAPAAPRAWT